MIHARKDITFTYKKSGIFNVRLFCNALNIFTENLLIDKNLSLGILAANIRRYCVQCGHLVYIRTTRLVGSTLIRIVITSRETRLISARRKRDHFLQLAIARDRWIRAINGL